MQYKVTTYGTAYNMTVVSQTIEYIDFEYFET